MVLVKRTGGYSNGLFLYRWNQFRGGLMRADVGRQDRTLDRQVWKGLLTGSVGLETNLNSFSRSGCTGFGNC
jgi:hypothetical protein